MSSLYHYCTFETLKCILYYKTLRLSDIRKSNDPKEIEFIFEKYQNWYLNQNDNSRYAKYNNAVLNIFKNIQLNYETFLVLCFSKNYDTLAMWNRYASKGVAIEFDENELTMYLHLIKHGIPDSFIEQKIPSEVEALIVRKLVYYNDLEIDKYYFEKKELNGDDDFDKLFNDAPFIKSDFYKDEDEVRIVLPFNYNSNIVENYLSLTDDDGFHQEKIFFKSFSNAIYQHKMIIDIPIPLSLIKSITIGPDSSLTEQDMKEILFIYGISNVEVKKSRGIFRN